MHGAQLPTHAVECLAPILTLIVVWTMFKAEFMIVHDLFDHIRGQVLPLARDDCDSSYSEGISCD